MKLYPNQTNILIDKINKKTLHSILLYGPNQGKAEIIFEQITKSNDFLIKQYDFKDITASIIKNSLAERNFFGQRQLVKIANCTGTLSKDIKEALAEETSSDNIICFLAPTSLAPSSALRKFYEQSKEQVSIACYIDSQIDIIKAAMARLQKESVRLDEEATQYLRIQLRGDEKIINNELDKLIIYAKDKNIITLSEIKQIISTDLTLSSDEMCIYYALGMYKLFLNELQKHLDHNINGILIIRAFMRFYLNIFQTILRIEDGQNIDDAIKKLNPPIFFKYVSKFKEIVNKLSAEDALIMVEKMQIAEVIFKTEPRNFNLLLLLNSSKAELRSLCTENHQEQLLLI